jgi:integrase/recombinase XerD
LTTGEIADLTVHDINIDRATIYVKAGRNINRILKLKDEQITFLTQYLTFDRPFLLKYPTNILLIGKLGQPEAGEGIQYLIECQRMLYPDRKLNPKTIRQSVLVNLFKKGWDLKDVQLFAGHKYPSTTEVYLPKDLSILKEAISKFHPLDDF